MILEETLQLLKSRLGGSFQRLTIQRVIFGLHITAVELSDGSIGFASTVPPSDDEVHCKKDKRYFGPFSPLQYNGQSVENLFALPDNKNLHVSLKTAVINALSSAELKGLPYPVIAGADPVDLINEEWLRGKKVVLVGAFHSYIEKFVSHGCSLKVLELNEEALQGNEKQYFAPAEQYPSLLPWADLVVITGLTLVNQTFEEVATALRPDSLNIVTGPSSSFLPDGLFSKNIHLVGGTRLTHPNKLFQLAAEGGAGYHLFRYCAEKITIVRNLHDPRLKRS
ncbi:MAG: Rossmann-like domain-containing protein [Bacteroidales bacterium]